MAYFAMIKVLSVRIFDHYAKMPPSSESEFSVQIKLQNIVILFYGVLQDAVGGLPMRLAMLGTKGGEIVQSKSYSMKFFKRFRNVEKKP